MGRLTQGGARAYRAVGAETIFPCSGAATTISFRVHARPLTPTLSPAGGEGVKHRTKQIRMRTHRRTMARLSS